MNSEMLEALLLDRALGGLTPEAQLLVSELLERDPEAAQQAREIEQTVSMARETFRGSGLPAENILPMPLDLRRRHSHIPIWTAGIAASLLFGFFCGRQTSPQITAQNESAAREIHPAKSSEFWSARSYLPQSSAHAGAPAPQPQLHWPSPVRRPYWKASL